MSTGTSSAHQKALHREQAALVRAHLRAVLTSPAFARGKRAREFLALVVSHAVTGHFSRLRERMIGAELFGRPVDYDTGSDSVVRVTATEVRRRLTQFYLESDADWPVRFELPSGSYEPHFVFAKTGTEAVAEEESSPPAIALLEVIQEQVRPGADLPGKTEALTVNPEVQTSDSGWVAWRLPILIATVVLILCGSIFAVYKRSRDSSNAPTYIRSVVILPMKNLSSDPEQEFFADGMTAGLINDLGQVSTLRVISLTSSMSFKGSRKLAPQVAKELGVQGIVEDTVQKEGEQIRIGVELIDGRTDRPVWA
jgi:TolB-like protein